MNCRLGDGNGLTPSLRGSVHAQEEDIQQPFQGHPSLSLGDTTTQERLKATLTSTTRISLTLTPISLQSQRFQERHQLPVTHTQLYLRARRSLFSEGEEQKVRSLEIYMHWTPSPWLGCKVQRELALPLRDMDILPSLSTKPKYSSSEEPTESSISTISLYWICRWWLGLNPNAKAQFPPKEWDTLLSKWEPIWLCREVLHLTRINKSKQISDKEPNSKLATWTIFVSLTLRNTSGRE